MHDYYKKVVAKIVEWIFRSVPPINVFHIWPLSKSTLKIQTDLVNGTMLRTSFYFPHFPIHIKYSEENEAVVKADFKGIRKRFVHLIQNQNLWFFVWNKSQ